VARQLARACGEIEDARSGADAERAQEVLNGVGGIVRAATLVRVSGMLEAAGELVNGGRFAQNLKYTRAPRSSKASW
jgi:hypothetical protein